MITPEQIGWSRYGGYEGAFFRGSVYWKLPVNPTEDEKRLAVVGATESGGAFDALNFYDQCICSVGMIQFCEAKYFLVSKLLHYVAEKCGADKILVPLKPALDLCDATFKKNSLGQWRFHYNDPSKGEVASTQMQRDLFLGCDGRIGSWTPEARSRVRLWAASMANIWQDKDACAAQAEYVASRLRSFVMPDIARAVFDGTPDGGWNGALRAAVISFSANLPAVASKHALIAIAASKSQKWSSDWCIEIIKEMTFGPNIAIYPIRYKAIRPVLESLWGVSLPKTADELKSWTPQAHDVVKPPAPEPTPSPQPNPKPAPPAPPPAPAPPQPPVQITPIIAGIVRFLQSLLSFVSSKKP